MNNKMHKKSKQKYYVIDMINLRLQTFFAFGAERDCVFGGRWGGGGEQVGLTDIVLVIIMRYVIFCNEISIQTPHKCNINITTSNNIICGWKTKMQNMAQSKNDYYR